MSPITTMVLIAACWIVFYGRCLAIWSWFRRRRILREHAEQLDRLYPTEEREQK